MMMGELSTQQKRKYKLEITLTLMMPIVFFLLVAVATMGTIAAATEPILLKRVVGAVTWHCYCCGYCSFFFTKMMVMVMLLPPI